MDVSYHLRLRDKSHIWSQRSAQMLVLCVETKKHRMSFVHCFHKLLNMFRIQHQFPRNTQLKQKINLVCNFDWTFNLWRVLNKKYHMKNLFRVFNFFSAWNFRFNYFVNLLPSGFFLQGQKPIPVEIRSSQFKNSES